MNKSKLTVSEFLHQCRQRIVNSINDTTILASVSVYGYTQERLETGETLLSESINLCEAFDKEHGEVEAAFAQRNAEREKANQTFNANFAVARVVFKNNPGASSVLRLSGRKASTLSGWLNQSRSFYNNLLSNPAWVEDMAAFNITEEVLKEGLAQVIKVEQYADVIMREKGDAQNATQTRDAKLEELAEWVSDYESIARVALSGNPQLLEKLGVVVKS